MERAQGAGLVGRVGGPVGRARHPRLPRRPAARARPAAGRRRARGAARRRRVRPAGRREGVAVRAERRGRRPAARRTTSRTSRRWPTRCTGRGPARPACDTPARQPRQSLARLRGVPVRAHRSPAHRAPDRGRDEPLAAVPRRAPAGAVRRGVAAARGGAGPGAQRLVPRRHEPHRRRGPGDGHRADPAAAGARPRGAPGLDALPLRRRRTGPRRRHERPARRRRRPQRAHPGEQGGHLRRPARPAPDRARTARLRRRLPPSGRHRTRERQHERQPVRPARRRRGRRRHVDHPPRVGFFTDTSVCIGCKACEVACKQWNGVPAGEQLDLLGMSHDNTGALGANSWRHVAFIEQPAADRRPRWISGCRRWSCPARGPGRRHAPTSAG